MQNHKCNFVTRIFEIFLENTLIREKDLQKILKRILCNVRFDM